MNYKNATQYKINKHIKLSVLFFKYMINIKNKSTNSHSGLLLVLILTALNIS